jgi:hypothetical protein
MSHVISITQSITYCDNDFPEGFYRGSTIGHDNLNYIWNWTIEITNIEEHSKTQLQQWLFTQCFRN